jgi:hypothetical protein
MRLSPSMPYQPSSATSSRSPPIGLHRIPEKRLHISDFYWHAQSESARNCLETYFSSVKIACCFPRTSISVCVRLRRANLTSPGLCGFTTDCPSGVVDFRSPSSRNTATMSLSWKCIGVATADVQVQSHTITRSFSSTLHARPRKRQRMAAGIFYRCHWMVLQIDHDRSSGDVRRRALRQERRTA